MAQNEELEKLAVDTAAANGIDPNLVKAIITVESAWDTWASRYEIGYRYLFLSRDFADSLGITPETEEILQKCSFGLMQCMGGKARELGLRGSILTLCLPEIGIKYGCLNLKKLMQRYGFETDVIAAYNAGSALKTNGGMYLNQQYVDRVYKVLLALRAPIA